MALKLKNKGSCKKRFRMKRKRALNKDIPAFRVPGKGLKQVKCKGFIKSLRKALPYAYG